MAIPVHESIRGWMQRLGLGRMRRAKKKRGGTWLVDHTNQISKEKVLAVLRVKPSARKKGALRHQDVEVLALVPGEEWKREDVARVYQETAERYGTPHSIVTDGAVELREPAEMLGKAGKKPHVLRDPKHFLANKLEALLKRDPNYEAFTQKLGRSRSALQQTELAHFIPPPFKAKARFMNLAPILRWASTILWHLDHPESASRETVTSSRMEEKLGWLRAFAASISQWEGCQEVISTTLTFINEKGIFRGLVKEYKKVMAEAANGPLSQQLVRETEALLWGYEKKLRRKERLPISTEILESSFSLYKHLEQQHSKSGFTSLLLTYPTLLHPATASEITACFAKVKIADVKKWVKENLPTTLASKRQRMFREAKTKRKPKTEKRATTLSTAA